MGRPVSENSVEPNYDDIQLYLMEHKYPEQFVGNSGSKINFRRLCSKYLVIDGLLYYKHKKHRNAKTGNIRVYIYKYVILFYRYFQILYKIYITAMFLY